MASLQRRLAACGDHRRGEVKPRLTIGRSGLANPPTAVRIGGAEGEAVHATSANGAPRAGAGPTLQQGRAFDKDRSPYMFL
jgi:hypothetical protein